MSGESRQYLGHGPPNAREKPLASSRKKKRMSPLIQFLIKLGTVAVILVVVFTFVLGVHINRGNRAGPDGDDEGKQVFIKPVDKNDVEPVPAANDASKYTVIGKPEFETGTDIELGTTDYKNDSAILTFRKGDSKKAEGSNSTKTIDFITVPDPTDVSIPAWYNSDEEYVEKKLELNFSGVTFLEPGVYRYTIKENQEYSENKTQSGLDPLPGLIFDPGPATRGGVSKERYLDVYVKDEDGVLVVSGYVLHEKAAAPTIDSTNKGTADVTADGNELTDKSTGFTNQYPTKSLAFKKEVQGNQASRDKFFKFTVTITPPTGVTINNSHWFELDMTDDKWVWSPAENVATDYAQGDMDAANNPQRSGTTDFKIEKGRIYINGAALTAGKVFYLQHGNSVMIRNLPAGVTYKVEEVAEDYAQLTEKVANYQNATTGVLKDEDGNVNRDGSVVSEAPDESEVATSFINKRNGVIPTGLLTVVGPAIAVILIAVVGLGIVWMGKRRKEERAE